MVSTVVRWLVALTAGFMSGFLVYIILALLIFSTTDGPPGWFGGVFLVVAVGSALFIIRGATTVSGVFSRSFLMGSAEWFVVIPVGVFIFSKVAVETEGTFVGAGLTTLLADGIAMVMFVFCLTGYFITVCILREKRMLRNTRGERR